jgi:pilus assembly protein CpaE
VRDAIHAVPNARLVAEVSDETDLTETLRNMKPSLLVVNLDPYPDAMLGLVETVADCYGDVPIIGTSENPSPNTIISAMRAGCGQFVAKPIEPGDLGRAVDRLTVNQTGLQEAGRRFAVIGASGGVGTTTIACNLALELASLSKSASAIVDLDLEFGDVATHFDCQPEYTLYDLCAMDRHIDRIILDKAVSRLPGDVCVLSRPRTVDEASSLQPERVGGILRLMSKHYDYVVIDTPRGLSPLSLSALEQSDKVLLVFQLTVPSIRNAQRLADTLAQCGMPEDRILLVANRYRTNIGRIRPEDVERRLGRSLYASVPNDYECVAASLDYGRSLMVDAPNSAVRAAIRDVAAQLLGVEPDPADGGGRRGLFSGFFGGARRG